MKLTEKMLCIVFRQYVKVNDESLKAICAIADKVSKDFQTWVNTREMGEGMEEKVEDEMVCYIR